MASDDLRLQMPVVPGWSPVAFLRITGSAAVVLFAVLGILAMTGLPGTARAGDEAADPYEILEDHFEASGGLDLLKAERTQYFEGSLSLGGMQGNIRAWTEKPLRNRAEIEIGPISITQGDNGEMTWALDTNGKLQKTTRLDDITLKRREVQRRMAEYEHADPASDVFDAVLSGIEEVEGTECYVIEVANSINTDRHIYYIGVDGLMLRKSIDFVGENSSDKYYGDYRRVDGIMVAFYLREIPHQTGQAHEIAIARYESNPDIDPALFEPPEEGGKDYRFTAGESAEDIPFRFVGNHLFIPVDVAGTERLWVIDTGAGMSVIDKAFADELGLDPEGDLKGRGAGGTVDASFASLPPFELKGISFDEQTMAVIDMSELIRRIGIDIAGILGFDFLSRFVTKVDYANELVSFYEPGSFEYTGGGALVDAHIEQGVFRVSATLDAVHSGTWLFDLGAGMTHLDGSYALREGYADENGVLAMGHGAGNEYQLKAVRADSIEIAGFRVYRPPVSFAYGGLDTVFTADRIGVLGNTLFRNFLMYIDYANEWVILERGEKFNQPWPEDHSGLSIGWTVERDGIEVLYVSPETPAERAGFEKGDILKSISGIDVEPEDGVIAVRKMLKDEPGVTHEIVVEREGRTKTMEITLAELY